MSVHEEVRTLERRVAQLEWIIQELVFLSVDGRVLSCWQDGVDLSEKVAGIRSVARPLPVLLDHLQA